MTSAGDPPRVVASVPVRAVPRWAGLQRQLFALLDAAWREFERCYCAADGRLIYPGTLHDRDGVDDFYEPFFTWPALYRLGGSDDLLPAAKRHWEGVTRQLTELGFLHDEYELGYDWFHQGESLNFFYALCAADPTDVRFRDRAIRFARLYLASSRSGNYDAATRTIVAPHTGSGGPRWGLGEDWQTYRHDQAGMRPYGLPLDDLDGIAGWDDLADADNAARMGQAMQRRMGRGDTAINLAATSLVTNAWLYEHELAFAEWVQEYVGAWRERAAANAGLLPDNVGPSGVVGELHHGHWYGGHYGWLWPHGLHSVEAAALIAATNSVLISGDLGALDLARVPLDTVIAQAVTVPAGSADGTLSWGSIAKLGVPPETLVQLVPFRHGRDGWFDFNPVPLGFPVWLWWLSGLAPDAHRLADLELAGGFDWAETVWFQDKEEQGHEAPWVAFLGGRNPGYPEAALELALAQVARRLALMRAAPHPPADDDIHWWQRLNPVVTEVLTQLTTGAPAALYNGGLSLARVLLADADRGRPGLPADVAAIVRRIDGPVVLDLVNLSATQHRTMTVQAGAFAEDRIDTVDIDLLAGGFPGDSHDYAIPAPVVGRSAPVPVGGPRIEVVLPPLSQANLRLTVTRRAFRPAHSVFTRRPSADV